MEQGSQDPQQQAPVGPSRRAIVGIGVIALLSTALAVIAVLLVQRYQARNEAALEAASGPAASAAAPATVRAVVTLPESQPKGIMRSGPAFDAPVVIMLPAGTALEMTNSVVKGGQTWCRVRTLGPPEASGWMHGNIVKIQPAAAE